MIKHTRKHSKVGRVARLVVTACEAMGLTTRVERSGASASRYVYVECDEWGECDGVERRSLKVRISDHEDKYCSSDIYVRVEDDTEWNCEASAAGVAAVAAHVGVPVPPKFTLEAMTARSRAAQAAGVTRRINRNKEYLEVSMACEVATRMQTRGQKSKVAAGKIIDEIFINIPRAQRQRVAYKASSIAQQAA